MNYLFDMSPIEFGLIRDMIHEKIGICLSDDKLSYLRMKLYPRVIALGLNSFSEYIQTVKYKNENQKEFMKMVSMVTNNETYFFREAVSLKVLQDEILADLKSRKLAAGNRTINILSAGCSTGEEAYTVSMLIFETGSFFWNWTVNIIGLDVNYKAVQAASKGIYYENSFRMTEPAYRDRFFVKDSGGYLVKEQIKKNTRFMTGNMVDPETWAELRDIDVILCRNVLIYFSEHKTISVLNNFYNALAEGGYLMLGHSESINAMPHNLEVLRYPNTIVYRKKRPETPKAEQLQTGACDSAALPCKYLPDAEP